MRRTAWLMLVLVLPAAAGAEDTPKTYRSDHAVVSYTGIGENWAKAVAGVVEAGRSAAIEQFGLDMPDTVSVSVTADRRQSPRLFTDGQDRIYLTLRSERDLRRPRYSRIYNLYGLCHELGHMAMYRVIRERGWMTTAAAEGWAHFLGSRLVDAVYAKAGEAAWPDRYDYRADGLQRLKRQLAARPGEIPRGAGQWMKLGEIIGDAAFAKLFKAWAEAKVDPQDPAAALRRALLATAEDPRLAAWWNKTEAIFVLRRPRSGFAARTLKPGDLAAGALRLARDDGKPAGKNSFAGGGHGVRFEVQGGDWYLAAVAIHGARYGRPRPPQEDFHVWLCDADFKEIADFPLPYSKFPRGASRWVTIPVTPTQVPPKFILCVGFNPTGTKGVYVSRDAEGSGQSVTGLPGRGVRGFSAGDWLIRAELYLPKTADALKAQP